MDGIRIFFDTKNIETIWFKNHKRSGAILRFYDGYSGKNYCTAEISSDSALLELGPG
jgi:hypothetical protein